MDARRNTPKDRARFAAVALAAVAFAISVAHADDVDRVAAEIRAEAARANDDPGGRPLPLASHWTTGIHPRSKGWAPANQMALIARGRHLLPWFQLPAPEGGDDEAFRAYYEQPIRRARELRLPIAFVDSQWERILGQSPYFDLPAAKNPNVIAPDGKVLHLLSPFGPVAPWRDVGKRLAASRRMKMLQAWYPDPPLVVFVSNNEQAKLTWTDVGKSSRYLSAYGTERDANFKRKVVADGWIERYRALQSAMRDELAEGWKPHAIFVGYDAFGPRHFARWGGWRSYSLYVPGRIDPSPLTWDGGSPSFYTDDWNRSTDFTVFSPQIEAMNWVFMQREVDRLNPRFWLELSVWDGHTGPDKGKRAYYAKLGQSYTPQRYAGMAQFGMWLLRPRVVREFRDWTYPWDEGEPYFSALMDAVDRVYANRTLRDFWRHGELVANRAHRHPYEVDVPPEYAGVDRWFLLDADVNPKFPWDLATRIPVFALAVVKGAAPKREWLVYAHAPLGDRRNVRLTLPGYGTIGVDVAVGGSFYVVDETKRSVEPVEPAAVHAATRTPSPEKPSR
jgi:hypothetical protein